MCFKKLTIVLFVILWGGLCCASESAAKESFLASVTRIAFAVEANDGDFFAIDGRLLNKQQADKATEGLITQKTKVSVQGLYWAENHGNDEIALVFFRTKDPKLKFAGGIHIGMKIADVIKSGVLEGEMVTQKNVEGTSYGWVVRKQEQSNGPLLGDTVALFLVNDKNVIYDFTYLSMSVMRNAKIILNESASDYLQ